MGDPAPATFFPNNRRYQGILLHTIERCGLGDCLQKMATLIVYCLNHDLYLKVAEGKFLYGSFLDIFNPFAEEIDETGLHVRTGNFSFRDRRIIDDETVQLTAEDWQTRAGNLTRKDVLVTLFRNQVPEVSQQVQKRLFQLTLDEDFISFHIRNGDKPWVYPPIEQYLRQIPRPFCEIRNFFIATDFYERVVDLENHNCEFNVYTQCETDSRSALHYNTPKDQQVTEIVRLISDIEMCAKAQYFVGSYSWVSYLVYCLFPDKANTIRFDGEPITTDRE